jgi:low affinity Fe/Cu permease
MDDDERSTRLTRAISRIAGYLGSFPAILLALGLVVGWLIVGMLVDGASRTSVFDLLTMFATVSTFVMVFIIQNTQNREERAVQTKLDAQAHALRQIMDRLDIPREHPLSRLAGLEEAPEKNIKQEQEKVRRGPQSNEESTGPNVVAQS